MTAAELRARTRKQLVELAKKHRIPGWHPMRKEELVRALAAATRRHAQANKNGSKSGKNGGLARKNGRGARTGDRREKPARRHVRTTAPGNGRQRAHAAARRDLSTVAAADNANAESHDTLVAQVCDPYWILVRWELPRDMIARAEAALGSEWHRAQPVIRIYDVTRTQSLNVWVRDVQIRGGQDHWYVPVDDPDRTYRLHIGYVTASDRFFTLAHSQSIRTVRDAASPRRPDRKNAAAASLKSISRDKEFDFCLDAELVVTGVTHPQAELTFSGIPVDLAKDGSFQFQMNLPNGRQLFPAVMVTPSGREEHTILLAVERNTKALEPKVVEEER